MTPLQRALIFTLSYEGGYANDPNDRGGETFRGISRVKWPSWDGWAVIDAAKAEHPGHFQEYLMLDDALKDSAVNFYVSKFWESISGDQLPGKYAVALFDAAVHSGPKTAVRLLQVSVKAAPDGVVGPQTVKCCNDAGEDGLVNFLAARAKYLHQIMDEDVTQTRWALNWFRRLFRLANVVLEGDGVEFPE